MIVLDSGAFVHAFGTGMPGLRRRLAALTTAHVPELFDAEVMNVARHRHLGERFDETFVIVLIQRLRTGPITRHPLPPMLDDMWRLHDNLAMYDAAYVTLAARLRLPLITTDRKLAANPRLPSQVEVYP